MPVLSRSLADWGSDCFAQSLLQELRALKPGELPLQSEGGWIDYGEITLCINHQGSDEKYLSISAGIFFQETPGGGSCGFESDPQQKYCEVLIEIDRKTGEASLKPV